MKKIIYIVHVCKALMARSLPKRKSLRWLFFSVIFFILWVFHGFFIVNETEQAIKLQFGRLTDKSILPGLHWRAPVIEQIHKENIQTIRSINIEVHALTRDDNMLDVKVAIQYNIYDLVQYVLKSRQPTNSIYEAAESVVYQVLGSSELTSALTSNRHRISVHIHHKLQQLLNRYETGIAISAVCINQADVPPQVLDAFYDVNRAQEDKIRKLNEAYAYANEIIPLARGKAERIVIESEAYHTNVINKAEGESKRFLALLSAYQKSPVVTRKRLYMKYVQSALENTTVVLNDTHANLLTTTPFGSTIQKKENADIHLPGKE